MDAEDTPNILQNRCTLMLYKQHFSWDGNYTLLQDWGVQFEVQVTNTQTQQIESYYSVYVRASHRSKGHMSNWLQHHANKKLITVQDCKLEKYFQSKHIEYKIFDKPVWPEYLAIEKAYGDHTAERTGVHLINHIDEGLYILNRIGANEFAQRAYCLHPLVQGDAELKEFWETRFMQENWDSRVVLLAIEYRNIANAYLSHCPSVEDFKLSPIEEVNQMLVADKIQNRKDFEAFHKGTHPKSERLVEYFGQWLKKLKISEEEYTQMVAEIYARVGGKAKFFSHK